MCSQQLFIRNLLQQPHDKSVLVLGTYNSYSKNAQDALSAQQLHTSLPKAQQAVYISPNASNSAIVSARGIRAVNVPKLLISPLL